MNNPSQITKEQLIAKAREQIEFCRQTKITGEGRTHVDQCLALFEISLAALDAEPVSQPYKLPPNSFTDAELEMMSHGDNPQANAYRELLERRLNSPATPDGWIPVSERMPDDTVDADGGATCYLVFYAEGRQPNGGSNVQVSNVTYLRRWHEGMITHWMPLPAAPKEVG